MANIRNDTLESALEKHDAGHGIENRELVAEIFELNEDQVVDELSPDTVELWDSMNHLKLVTALEEAFGIKFPMRDVMSMTSVSRIRELVAQHMQDR